MPAMKRRTRFGSTGFHHTPSRFSALATSVYSLGLTLSQIPNRVVEKIVYPKLEP